MSSTEPGQPGLARLKRRLDRERKIREEAERISERITRELYDRQQELVLLEVVAKEWNAATTIDEAIHIAIHRICDHTEWPVGHAYLCEGGRELRSAPIWYLEDPERFEGFRRVSEETTFKAAEGLPGRILETGEPAWIQDVVEDENFPRGPQAREVGIHAAFGFPVVIAGEVVAILEFFAAVPLEPDEALLRSIRQIGVQLSQFIERTRAEDEADRLKAEFFALVSHELRTPLTSIRGYLDLVVEEEADGMGETGRRFLDVITRNAVRLDNLVQDLLLVTQVEAGSFTVRLGSADLGSIAREAVETARPRAGDREIELSLDLEEVPECSGDAERLGQAFDNVISNAIKFTPEGGRIDVRVRNAGPDAVLEFEDTGPGIPADELEHLFDRFYRTKGTQDEVIQGVGLGLAITQAIVEAHKGKIRVESEVGEGTTFESNCRSPRPLEMARGWPW